MMSEKMMSVRKQDIQRVQADMHWKVSALAVAEPFLCQLEIQTASAVVIVNIGLTFELSSIYYDMHGIRAGRLEDIICFFHNVSISRNSTYATIRLTTVHCSKAQARKVIIGPGRTVY
jgi:hypothetical protein